MKRYQVFTSGNDCEPLYLGGYDNIGEVKKSHYNTILDTHEFNTMTLDWKTDKWEVDYNVQ